LVAGGKPLEEWILDFVSANPGCSKNRVREGVVGANPAIDAAVESLLAAGNLVNDGSASGYALRVAPPERAPDPNP
jgi:hypothetical protein